MVSRNSASKANNIANRTISAIVVLGLLALGGRSTSEPSAATQAALAKTELHFDINTCQQIAPNLYKCPAVDKPICNPDFFKRPLPLVMLLSLLHVPPSRAQTAGGKSRKIGD